jgi:hypothetical protein
MSGRWDPAVPLETEESEVVYVDRHGVKRAMSNRIYSREDTEYIRQGYKCIQCGEAQERAFPERCEFCSHEMAARQALEFARDFRGTVHLGSQVDVDEELEFAAQYVESERRNREGTAPAQVWLPGWLPKGM